MAVRSRSGNPPRQIVYLEEMLSRAGIPSGQWDLVLVGDGSGSKWTSPCGWSVVLADRRTRQFHHFHGAASPASVNFAEAIPYLHALTWFDSQFGKTRLREQMGLRVVVITDSQVIARWGAQATNVAVPVPDKQRMIWASVRELARAGYQFQFRWAARDTSSLNKFADVVAARSRRAVMEAEPPFGQSDREALGSLRFLDPETEEEIRIDHLNPWRT